MAGVSLAELTRCHLAMNCCGVIKFAPDGMDQLPSAGWALYLSAVTGIWVDTRCA